MVLDAMRISWPNLSDDIWKHTYIAFVVNVGPVARDLFSMIQPFSSWNNITSWKNMDGV